MTTSNQNESASNLRGVTGNTPRLSQTTTAHSHHVTHPPRLRRLMITCHNALMLYKIMKQNRSSITIKIDTTQNQYL